MPLTALVFFAAGAVGGSGVALAASPADPPVPVEVQRAIDAGRAAGVPLERLDAKAREGLAKAVPPERIAAALAQVTRSWVAADALVGDVTPAGPPHDRLVEAAAAAIGQGASPDAVAALASGPLPTDALWTVVDVVGLGLAPDAAERLVGLAARGPNPGVALRELPDAARAGVASWGVDAAAAALEDALGKGQPPLAALEHGLDGAPGRSALAPGHGGDKGSKANGNAGTR